jgi:hypothetical protein
MGRLAVQMNNNRSGSAFSTDFLTVRSGAASGAGRSTARRAPRRGSAMPLRLLVAPPRPRRGVRAAGGVERWRGVTAGGYCGKHTGYSAEVGL